MELTTPKTELTDFSFVESDKYYWWASWYADILGYSSLTSILPSIEKAKLVCLQLGISTDENFIPAHLNGKKDIKLTKFACFLISYQADARKPIVKRARRYFLHELEEINVVLQDQDYLLRISERNELTKHHKSLVKQARRAHVKDFQFFINEGYLGMYNHTMVELKAVRGLSANANMSEYIGTTELAANIFRISLIKEKLKSIRNPSEQKAAREHWKIGNQIRALIKINTGSYPEELPLQTNLKRLQKKLKKAQAELNKVLETKTIT